MFQLRSENIERFFMRIENFEDIEAKAFSDTL
jgi:hypothetical protein